MELFFNQVGLCLANPSPLQGLRTDNSLQHGDSLGPEIGTLGPSLTINRMCLKRHPAERLMKQTAEERGGCPQKPGILWATPTPPRVGNLSKTWRTESFPCVDLSAVLLSSCRFQPLRLKRGDSSTRLRAGDIAQR